MGFEPTVQFNPYDDLANRSFRPLRHLSKIPIYNKTPQSFTFVRRLAEPLLTCPICKGWQKYNYKRYYPKLNAKKQKILNKEQGISKIEVYTSDYNSVFLAVVFQCDKGALEKQGPDERAISGFLV